MLTASSELKLVKNEKGISIIKLKKNPNNNQICKLEKNIKNKENQCVIRSKHHRLKFSRTKKKKKTNFPSLQFKTLVVIKIKNKKH